MGTENVTLFQSYNLLQLGGLLTNVFGPLQLSITLKIQPSEVIQVQFERFLI